MATAFMRWLERRPATYDRGIRLLTLGRLERLYDRIEEYLRPEQHVLEIGCGTGALTQRLAAKTTRVDAIDVSADMLAVARKTLADSKLLDHVQLARIDALTLDHHFTPHSFDLIVSSLAFSELSTIGQEHVLRLCHGVLKPEGSLLILDEVEPSQYGVQIFSRLIRAPIRMITWLLTRTTTHPLEEFIPKLVRSGFEGEQVGSALGGTLCIYKATPRKSFNLEQIPDQVRQLRHHNSLATRWRDAWALFFRVLPPYPRVEPDLYAIGEPQANSPVLVTGNYDLTVRRLVAAIDRRVDAWLLVVDSSGINVWCGAGGGFLTAERVMGALNMSGIEAWHAGRQLVLPQLCANGVDGEAIRDQTGWQVHWGPVRADDIPAYIQNNYNKTDGMRTVMFPWKDRLEMVSATLGLYGLMILVPVAIFWRENLWPVLIALIGLSYFYALALPKIPGSDGLAKSLPLALIALVGMLAYSFVLGSYDPQQLFRRGVGMVALSVFVAAELQGMSPLMRGEQANWGWEAVIALALGGLYWLLPRLVGWSA